MAASALREILNLFEFLFITINQGGKEVLLENVFTLNHMCCLLRTSLHMSAL